MKILSVLAILVLTFSGLSAQESTNNVIGNWVDGTSWTDGSAVDRTNVNVSTTINGYITLGSPSPAPATPLTFRNNPDQAGLSFTINDILVVYGDITMGNNAMDLRLGAGALLVVIGNVTLGNNMDINSTGNIVVTGTFSKSGAANQGSYTGGGNIYSPNTIDVPGTWMPAGDKKNFTDLANDLPNVSAFLNNPTLNPLPVELTSFESNLLGEEVHLNWSTASQLNFSHFEVEQSINARDWNVLTSIKGERTTNDLKEYSFAHATPQNGKNYYRLRMVDFDETYEYSDVVSETVSIGNMLSISPNPTSGGNARYTLNFTPSDGDQIVVYDLMGAVILINSVRTFSEELVLPSSLTKGTYLVQYKGQSINLIQRLIVE